jgi:hypothetical protein
MSSWQLSVSWDVVRASGFTAYLLLSASVVMGLLLSLRWQSRHWPRLVTNEVHQYLTLLAVAYSVVHGIATWLDPFMRFHLAELLVPMASHYRPLWVTMGILSLYLAVAVLVTTWLRPYLGYRLWRSFHVSTFVVYILATLHGLGTGTDTRTWYGLLVYGGSVWTVLGLVTKRLLQPAGRTAKPRPALAGLSAASALGLALWTYQGPLRPGWNAIANNGHGSGARIALAAQPRVLPGTGIPTSPFTASWKGRLTAQQGATGLVDVQMVGTVTGGAEGTLVVDLQGIPVGLGGALEMVASRVRLYGRQGTLQYQGTVTAASGSQLQARLAPVNGSSRGLSLRIRMSIQGTRVSGIVSAVPASLELGPILPEGGEGPEGLDHEGTEDH